MSMCVCEHTYMHHYVYVSYSGKLSKEKTFKNSYKFEKVFSLAAIQYVFCFFFVCLWVSIGTCTRVGVKMYVPFYCLTFDSVLVLCSCVLYLSTSSIALFNLTSSALWLLTAFFWVVFILSTSWWEGGVCVCVCGGKGNEEARLIACPVDKVNL